MLIRIKCNLFKKKNILGIWTYCEHMSKLHPNIRLLKSGFIYRSQPDVSHVYVCSNCRWTCVHVQSICALAPTINRVYIWSAHLAQRETCYAVNKFHHLFARFYSPEKAYICFRCFVWFVLRFTGFYKCRALEAGVHTSFYSFFWIGSPSHLTLFISWENEVIKGFGSQTSACMRIKILRQRQNCL